VVSSIFLAILSSVIFYLQKEMEGSLKARKGGAYKLNLHPKAYFDGNPYKSDRRKHRE